MTPRDDPSMSVLDSSLSVRSDAFRANRDRMRRLIGETSAIASEIMLGGPAHARTRHLERGKLLPRERVSRLLDPGSPFLEVGLFAAHGMYGGEVPSAGLVTGVGRIAGVECMVVCNDATVKGGTYYPVTVKKQLRAQEIAEAEPAAVRVPRRFGRSEPPEPGRGLPRPRALRPHLLQPGQHVRRGHRPRSRW